MVTKNIAIPAIVSSPPNFKILPTHHMEVFWVSNPNWILKKGRNYVPIIFTIISNITVLVSGNVIRLGYFMPMSNGINKKTPIFFPTPSTYQIFH